MSVCAGGGDSTPAGRHREMHHSKKRCLELGARRESVVGPLGDSSWTNAWHALCRESTDGSFYFK